MGKKSEEMNRRHFCKQGSLAALGLGWVFGTRQPEALFPKKESTMAKKITGVEVKVIQQTGHCDVGHKVGDVARIHEKGVDGKICIHALYSMMSGAFAMLFDAQFPWLKDPEVKTHACPDYKNPVVFEIRKIRG